MLFDHSAFFLLPTHVSSKQIHYVLNLTTCCHSHFKCKNPMPLHFNRIVFSLLLEKSSYKVMGYPLSGIRQLLWFMAVKIIWQHETPLRWTIQWKKKPTRGEVVYFCSMIWKKIHLLWIGPALIYSWTSFPVTLFFSGCFITILTQLMLKPYKHAVISDASHRLFSLPAMLFLRGPQGSS